MATIHISSSCQTRNTAISVTAVKLSEQYWFHDFNNLKIL